MNGSEMARKRQSPQPAKEEKWQNLFNVPGILINVPGIVLKSSSSDKRHLIGEDRGEQRQIARSVMGRAEPVADRSLPFGETVEIARGRELWAWASKSVLVLFSAPRRATVAHARRTPHARIARRPRRRARFALKFEGRKRIHDADELMSEIVAKRLVRHLERAGSVVMKKPPTGGHWCSGAASRADAVKARAKGAPPNKSPRRRSTRRPKYS